MNAKSIHVQRTATVLRPDQSRVLLRPFSQGNPQRTGRIIARIMSLPEDQVGPLLDEVSAEFSQRHQQIHKAFLERFEQVRDLLLTDEEIPDQRQLLRIRPAHRLSASNRSQFSLGSQASALAFLARQL
jgi:hypothetical protein